MQGHPHLYLGYTSVVEAVLKEGPLSELETNLTVLAAAWIPMDPVQMILSSFNEKPEGQVGPGHPVPSTRTAGSGGLALRELYLLSQAWWEEPGWVLGRVTMS